MVNKSVCLKVRTENAYLNYKASINKLLLEVWNYGLVILDI